MFFDIGWPELMLIGIVALVVIGPKDLPRLLRSAGRMIGQAKRAISDVKRETGLDEVLRGDFQDLERLADHIEDLRPYRGDDVVDKRLAAAEDEALRAREYPLIGADSTGLLPEDSEVYVDAQVVTRADPSLDEASREGAHT